MPYCDPRLLVGGLRSRKERNLLSNNFLVSVSLHPGGGEVVVLQGLVQRQVEVAQVLQLLLVLVLTGGGGAGGGPGGAQASLLCLRSQFGQERSLEVDGLH